MNFTIEPVLHAPGPRLRGLSLTVYVLRHPAFL